MLPMPIGDLEKITRQLTEEGRRIQVLWQVPQSLCFVARGREYRSEFHIDPSDELMYMIKGEMNLHYREADGKEDISVLKEGEIIYTAAGIPHSPRFPPDSFLLVMERKRLPGEIDRYQIEKRYLHKDGRVIWALCHVTAASDDHNHYEHAIVQVIDITEAHQL